MEYIEFKNRLQESFQTQKIDVSEKQCKKFFEYMKLLIEWNEKINLTAIVEPGQVITKHFLDSLTILNYIGTKQQKIIDVGTGAGFPGIPIKIMDDLSEITLIDSLNKRINFLQEVINKNNLKNIRAIHGRAEDFGQDKLYREKYDVCVAIGPMIMMKFVCLLTKELNLPTIVSLNPIMVDGTGMCGACRVMVGDEVKFACVDGPEFDGHLIDFDQAMQRQAMYRTEEGRAKLAFLEGETHHGGCGHCGGDK